MIPHLLSAGWASVFSVRFLFPFSIAICRGTSPWWYLCQRSYPPWEKWRLITSVYLQLSMYSNREAERSWHRSQNYSASETSVGVTPSKELCKCVCVCVLLCCVSVCLCIFVHAHTYTCPSCLPKRSLASMRFLYATQLSLFCRYIYMHICIICVYIYIHSHPGVDRTPGFSENEKGHLANPYR